MSAKEEERDHAVGVEEPRPETVLGSEKKRLSIDAGCSSVRKKERKTTRGTGYLAAIAIFHVVCSLVATFTIYVATTASGGASGSTNQTKITFENFYFSLNPKKILLNLA